MTITEPQYYAVEEGSKFLSFYNVTISNILQSNFVLSQFSLGLPLRQITHGVLQNRKKLNFVSKTGLVSDVKASRLARIACVVCLQMRGDLMSMPSAHSIASDTLKDDFGNCHLDVHAWLPSININNNLLSS